MEGITMDVTKQTKVDKTLPIKRRIAFLKFCADKYETDGSSPISDAIYDKEYYELESLDPDNKFFEEVGGIDKDHIYGTAVPHEVTMGSLSKCPDIESFDFFVNQNYPSHVPSFVLEHKIDGTSLSLIYDDGKLVRAASRGDGTNGFDVTANAVYVKGIRKTIPYKGKVEVRGEVFKDRADFYKHWHVSVGGEYKNPRNFTAGSMNQKDATVTKERGLDFLAYEVVQKDFDTEVEKNRFLKSLGFPTIISSTKRTKEGITRAQLVRAVKHYMAQIDRSKLPYDIDGVVVKLNDVVAAKKRGYTAGGRKPKANRAVKFPPEQKETILLGVEVNVGRSGKITPVGLLKPVELGGAMIGRATLHNFGMLRTGKYRIGARVVVAKKGDIIPQIIAVKSHGDKDIEIPYDCPSCGERLVWTSNKADLVCENLACIAQLNKRIEHWFKKLGVKGFAGKTIARLTNQEDLEWEGRPIVESLAEMYYMLDNDRKSKHPFRKYSYLEEQLGEKKYANLKEAVKSVDEVPLAKFIEALGIGKVGTLAVEITNIAPTVHDIDDLTIDDLTKIDKFAEKKAQSFIEGWKTLRPDITLLLKYIKIVKQTFSSDKLKDKSFCFTGSFDSPRNKLQDIVKENGGKAASSVGKTTILVWDGEERGSKYNKAIANGNEIISEDDFWKLLK